MEILVVVVLLGLVAALVFPSFTRGIDGMEMRTATRDLITRMKQARTHAISSQSVQRILIGADEEGKPFYALADEYGEITKSFALPEKLSILTEDGELPLQISFYPNGRSSGGDFVLQLDENRHMKVSVDPVTGFGRIPKDEEADRR